MVEYILKGIIGLPIKIKSLTGQKEFKNPDENKKSIVMDVYALDMDGNAYCLEVQNDISKASIERLSFYSAFSEFQLLDKGSDDYRKIKHNSVIFLCGEDKLQKGKPLYKFVFKEDETNERANDKKELIYVNGDYKGDHPIADIVHDMKCANI